MNIMTTTNKADQGILAGNKQVSLSLGKVYYYYYLIIICFITINDTMILLVRWSTCLPTWRSTGGSTKGKGPL